MGLQGLSRLSRGLIGGSLGLVVAASGCTTTASDDVQRYLDDPAFRRSELTASLVDADNGYSRRRLERYRNWEQLPEWNPRVAPVAHAMPIARALAISEPARAGDRDALIALGEAAFFTYPAQELPLAATTRMLRDGDYGLWTDGDRFGGLVEVEMADGTRRLAYTCATCHAAVRDGHVVAGLANTALDLGRLVSDLGQVRDPARLAWGPGRADVSTTTGDEPVRIPDLRATRYQTHLQVNATVEQRGIASLALRIETLLVTGHGEILRPPRTVSLGLALYLWSLAPASRVPHTGAEIRGRATFEATCRGCHVPPTFAGAPVPLDAIGVDAVGLSIERGTGRWRVPSLVGVAARGSLLHDGSATTLEAVLDPRRLGGHRFGLGLDADTRADLVAYLRTL